MNVVKSVLGVLCLINSIASVIPLEEKMISGSMYVQRQLFSSLMLTLLMLSLTSCFQRGRKEYALIHKT